jgi:3-deoxy-D-manno-octulosonic-acid transferase
MRIIYTTTIYCYQFLVRFAALFNETARFMVKGQRETLQLIRQRLQSYPHKYTIWFHAASLGEFEQGRPLMEMVKKQLPDVRIVLTFFSPSGYEVRKNYEGADVVCYLPFDTPRHVRAFLNLVQPDKAIFIKYEFWANYLYELHQRAIPTLLVSAIFRQDQLFFKPYGAFYRRLLTLFEHLFVQDKSSADLLSIIGVKHVTVAGDTRFDRVAAIAGQAKTLPIVEAFAAEKRVLVAGSSWSADEALLIPFFNSHPEIRLILAPHVTGESHIEAICGALERPFLRYSRATVENARSADCLVIDSIGLLSSIYRYGEMAYIGGGFGVGIHNVLEAAVYNMPVVFGPNYGKFREARELITCGGGFSINSENELTSLLSRFLNDSLFLSHSGEEAGMYVYKNKGASEKIMHQLIPVEKTS